MATKVKPTRLQITWTPQAWDVPVYVDSDCFCWGAWWGWWWSWDMEKCVYDPNNCNDDAFDYCNFYNTPNMSCYAQCSDIPTDNCELSNGCWYTTCTWTLSSCSDVISALWFTPYSCTNPAWYTTCTWTVVASDLTPYAKSCDLCTVATSGEYCDLTWQPIIPTDNCQLANWCWYTTCTWTLSSCADVISALWYTPYNCTNPAGYTTCTGTVVASDIVNLAQCCDIPTDNCQLTNGCWYTTCTGTLVSSDIACVNGCCLTNWWNITISWGADYSWCTQTISWGNVTLCLRTIVNVPTSDFTLVKPDTLIDWEEYAIRVISETSYCMCLGSCFTNPRNVNTYLSWNATDQYVFLSIWWELELQPLVDTWA